jgi:hypothetical protein
MRLGVFALGTLCGIGSFPHDYSINKPNPPSISCLFCRWNNRAEDQGLGIRDHEFGFGTLEFAIRN